MTVLLIDDNSDFVIILANALEYFGNVVISANCGRSGIEKFKSSRPDIVICDIGLPQVTGYDVARELRKLSSQVAQQPLLIALSGYGNESDKLQAFEAGFDKHFTKPVNLEELINAIER